MTKTQATVAKDSKGIWTARDSQGRVIVSAKQLHVAKAELDRWGYEIVPNADQMNRYFA